MHGTRSLGSHHRQANESLSDGNATSNSPSFKRFFQRGCWDGVGVSKGSKLLSHNTEILENQETKDLGTGFLLFTFERDRI